MQRLLAITWLTWKAALRFRLFLVIAALLLLAVVGLPILIKDDGTARGFTQILLTYTLSVITGLLGLSTLWLSCGTLARDIEENQIQVVATKPIARWQIWLGKWLGIVSLNAALLTLAGASVYFLLQWRATKLPADEQAILRDEVLVARGSARPPDRTQEIAAQTERVLQERLQNSPPLKRDEIREVRQQIAEQIRAEFQVVPAGYTRVWEIDLGVARHFLKDKPLQLRVKFNSADKSPTGTFAGMWRAGIPEKTELWGTAEPMSLAPDTFHEFVIAPNTFDENGLLRVEFWNLRENGTTLLFPLEEGFEVLYREGGFGLNFARGLAIIFCWMALLAALGLFAASFLSFPVAAFFALGLLTMALSSGTLATVVEEGTVMGSNEETGEVGSSIIDIVIVPAFRVALAVINLARDFSPIEALSSGRSITWVQLARAVGQIVFVLGGIVALLGIGIFNRRELAAQGSP
ncbi:MAG TPA: hypothetical protein VEH04_19920 [Verrucomicrobiae bacterium]|nr:hypothetical protein [Verrucomicrobiae bacterium]